MKIITERYQQGTLSTLGKLWVNGKHIGFVLEDMDRGLSREMGLEAIKEMKVYGETAIPTGIYQVAITQSTKFGQPWPELLNVPGYSGIRPHAGNYVAHTFGCQLIGSMTPKPSKDKLGYWRVWDSQKAWKALRIQIDRAIKDKEAISWEITRKYV